MSDAYNPNQMSYFEAFVYLRNKGYSATELDSMTIPHIRRLAAEHEGKSKKTIQARKSKSKQQETV